MQPLGVASRSRCRGNAIGGGFLTLWCYGIVTASNTVGSSISRVELGEGPFVDTLITFLDFFSAERGLVSIGNAQPLDTVVGNSVARASPLSGRITDVLA